MQARGSRFLGGETRQPKSKRLHLSVFVSKEWENLSQWRQNMEGIHQCNENSQRSLSIMGLSPKLLHHRSAQKNLWGSIKASGFQGQMAWAPHFDPLSPSLRKDCLGLLDKRHFLTPAPLPLIRDFLTQAISRETRETTTVMITNEPMVIALPFNCREGCRGVGGGRFLSTCFVSPIQLRFTQEHTATPDLQKSWKELLLGYKYF